jgi:hypothetical protein
VTTHLNIIKQSALTDQLDISDFVPRRFAGLKGSTDDERYFTKVSKHLLRDARVGR